MAAEPEAAEPDTAAESEPETEAEPEPQPAPAAADGPAEPVQSEAEPEAAEPAEPVAEAAEPEPEASAAEPEPGTPEPEPEPTEPEPDTAESAPETAEPETAAEPAEQKAEPAPDPEPDPEPEKKFVPDVVDVEEFDSDDDVRSWVRPYVWTGGRTTTSLEFALETMVSAKKPGSANGDVIRHEHQQVLELCERPRSVSEIAALLSVPLGAAKALLGVMAEEDLLVVHRTGNAGGDGPDLELMERVLRGLRKL